MHMHWWLCNKIPSTEQFSDDLCKHKNYILTDAQVCALCTLAPLLTSIPLCLAYHRIAARVIKEFLEVVVPALGGPLVEVFLWELLQHLPDLLDLSEELVDQHHK